MQTHRWFYTIAAIGIGLLSVAILLSLPAAAQSPRPSTSGPTVASPGNGVSTSSPADPNAILYDQYDNPASAASNSQNFEPAFDAYDDFLADDFVVPYGKQWAINQVDVRGQYFSGFGPADSMNIFIYSEAITLPGALVASRTDISFTNTSNDFTIPLTTPIVLSPGKYWLSVQANQVFSTTGEWGWTDRSIINNHPAAWQNPGGGFGICQTWKLRTICVGDPAAGDQVFRLDGTSSPYIQPLTCGLGAPGPWRIRNYLPVPAYGPGVASDGGVAYVVGGYSFQAGKDITQTVRYDPAANTWAALAPAPVARSMASVVYAPVNNKLYVFGGENIGANKVFSTTLIYDIASNTWATGALMPDVRAFMGAGYYNGKIYLVGGYSTGSITPAFSQTWEYDVTSNTWATKASMPEALGGAASAVVDGHLYVMGGRDISTSARNQTYDYDIVHDTWSSRLNLPYGVNVAGAAVLGGQVWVIGGGNPFLTLDGSSSTAESNAPQAIATTLIFDPGTNSWTAGPALNVPRSFVGATGIGNLAVAFGGYDGSASTDATEVTIDCPAVHFSAAGYTVNENAGTILIPVTLNPASLITATVNFITWDGTATAGSDYTTISGTLTFPPGVTSRTFSVSILDDLLFEGDETAYLYLTTGVNATLAPPNPAVLTIVDNDPPPPLACGNNTPGPWVLRNFLPQAVYGPGVATDGVSAYVIGGYSFQAVKDITQTVRYDPAANTWTALAPVPDARMMASAVYAPINNKLYVFGGEIAAAGKVYSSTLIYDIGSNTWTSGAPMPDVRAFMAAGYENGKVYLVGGYSTGSVTSAISQTWEYNVTANSWITKTSMPEALGGAASAVVNGHLYVIGGRDAITSTRNQTYDYDIALDSWSTQSNVPYGVNVAGAAVRGGKIWVMGGGTPFASLDGTSSFVNTNLPEAINTTLIYDPAANTWATGPNLNIPRSFVGAAGFGIYAVAIGGYSGSTTTGATEVSSYCSTDLSAVMTDAPNPVFVGQNLVYRIRVTNLGPTGATGLTLVDTLPAEVTFLSASPGCANLSGVVTCSLPDLASSNGVTVTITVIPITVGIRTNTATVTCTENDPVSGNNTSTVQTTVIYHKVYLPLVKK